MTKPQVHQLKPHDEIARVSTNSSTKLLGHLNSYDSAMGHMNSYDSATANLCFPGGTNPRIPPLNCYDSETPRLRFLSSFLERPGFPPFTWLGINPRISPLNCYDCYDSETPRHWALSGFLERLGFPPFTWLGTNPRISPNRLTKPPGYAPTQAT